jgi:lysophospholipase L1-like esterase
MPTTTFDYDNLNPRGLTIGGRALRLIPGVRRVAATTRPYAAWWREQNLAALRADDGPLWVVLGDSMSQGIGASAVERGYVPLTTQALRAQGIPVRVLNLSFSGARTADVTELQLPVMRAVAPHPALVTVMIGSNDLIRRSLREALPARYAELLRALPPGTRFTTWPRGGLASVAPIADSYPHVVPVPMAFRGGVAEDRYHPNDATYANMAEQLVAPLAHALGA